MHHLWKTILQVRSFGQAFGKYKNKISKYFLNNKKLIWFNLKFIFFLWYILFDFQKVHRRDRLYSYLATMGLGTPSRRGRLSQNILNNEAVKTFIRRENIILWTSKVSNIISSSFHTRTFIVWCFWNYVTHANEVCLHVFSVSGIAKYVVCYTTIFSRQI